MQDHPEESMAVDAMSELDCRRSSWNACPLRTRGNAGPPCRPLNRLESRRVADRGQAEAPEELDDQLAPPERIRRDVWSRASPRWTQCSAARGSARRVHEVSLCRPPDAAPCLPTGRRNGTPSSSGGDRGPRAIRDAIPHRDPGFRVRRHALARLPSPAAGDRLGSGPGGRSGRLGDHPSLTAMPP